MHHKLRVHPSDDKKLGASDDARARRLFALARAHSKDPSKKGIDLKAFKLLIKELFADHPEVSFRDRDLEVAFQRADVDKSKCVDENEFLKLFEDVKAGKVEGLGLFAPRGPPVLEFSGEAPESWNRYYSQRKESWFMFNHTTGEVFWESRKIGDRW